MRGPRRPQPGETLEFYHGYPVVRTRVNGREVVIIKPHARLLGRPWIWRTESQESRNETEMELLRRGFTYIHADLGDPYGSPTALAQMDAIYDKTQDFGLSVRVIVEGFGRGALAAYRWAAKRPSKIACIYADAPVCDIKSWPGGKGKGPGSAEDWSKLLAAYQLTEAQALEFKENPIDLLAPLLKYQVPLLHVCASEDEIAPNEENTTLLAARYREMGGTIRIIERPGKHLPYGVSNATPVVECLVEIVNQRVLQPQA